MASRDDFEVIQRTIVRDYAPEPTEVWHRPLAESGPAVPARDDLLDALDAKDHGVDCASIGWDEDGINGESGEPCDCWKSLLCPVEPPAHREPELDERCSEGMLITEHTRVAVPARDIDRDALLLELADLRSKDDGSARMLFESVDRILALVRPVERGVTWPEAEAEAVLDAIRECAPLNMELRTDPGRLGTEDPQTAAYVEGVHAAYDAAKRALAARLEASS